MVYKNIDNKDELLKKYEELLRLTNYNKEILRDYTNIKKGYGQELDSAYILNYHFESRKNSIVLHDVRLDIDGQTAQFDHIIVSLFGISIFESKYFSNKIEIDRYDNWYIYTQNNKKIGIKSPIQQNQRHRELLLRFLKEKDLIPKRLGIEISFDIKDFVLLSSQTVVEGKIPKNVVKYDIGAKVFDDFIDDDIDKYFGLNATKMFVNLMTKKEMKDIAKSIVRYNKPVKFDIETKYLKYLYDKNLYKKIENSGAKLEKKELILLSYKKPKNPQQLNTLLKTSPQEFKKRSLHKALNVILKFEKTKKVEYA